MGLLLVVLPYINGVLLKEGGMLQFQQFPHSTTTGRTHKVGFFFM